VKSLVSLYHLHVLLVYYYHYVKWPVATASTDINLAFTFQFYWHDRSAGMHRISVCLLLAGLSLTHAAIIYLNPAPVLPPRLSPGHASFALSRHLGLEYFESLGTNDEPSASWMNEGSFVGQGSSNGLLLCINELEAKEVLPSSIQQSFTLKTDFSVSSPSSIISTFLHRAQHAYSHIYSAFSAQPPPPSQLLHLFSIPSPSTDQFLSESTSLSAFLESSSTGSEYDNSFAAFELKGLSEIAHDFGRTSEQYVLAARTTRALIESAMAQPNIHLALLTFTPTPDPPPHAKRQDKAEVSPQQSPHAAPQQPIGSLSTCFYTAEMCEDETEGCSGRGECVSASKAGRTCFVCACEVTESDQGRKESWAGEACERKDISGPFVLITGTVIGFILLIGGSVSLLYTVGGQELPSVLMGGVVSGRKD